MRQLLGASNTYYHPGIRYYDDMYVDFDLAQETAAKVANTEQFITNQMFHDGLRQHTKEVVGKLFEISKREHV